MTLHMIHAPLDLRCFNGWAARRGLIARGDFDEGAALHTLLTALFGRRRLQPFRLFAPARGRRGSVYAYAAEDERALAAEAATHGTPDDLEVLPPAALRSKAMPIRFDPGRRLGFDLRTRPLRRTRSDPADPRRSKPRTPPRVAELDAFLLEALTRFPDGAGDPEASMATAGRGREQVYRDWLGERLAPAARLESLRLAQFRRDRVFRKGRWVEGPDATLQGTLVVEDAEAFSGLLEGGVGRHKAYGYGMLILRPPDRAPLSH